jgi:hypothetical protein
MAHNDDSDCAATTTFIGEHLEKEILTGHLHSRLNDFSDYARTGTPPPPQREVLPQEEALAMRRRQNSHLSLVPRTPDTDSGSNVDITTAAAHNDALSPTRDKSSERLRDHLRLVTDVASQMQEQESAVTEVGPP